mgnify:CR=1 FL=1
MASRRDHVWLSPDSYFFHLGHEDWFRAVNLNLGGAADRFLFGSSYPLTPLKAFVYNFLLSEGLSMMGAGGLIFTAVIWLIAFGLFFYSRAMAKRGMLR